MTRIILERPDGTRYTIAPGENHPGEDRAVGIERNGVNVSEEEKAAQVMLAEIEKDLALEGMGTGDWVKFFAKPVALLLGKTNCMFCEFRRVCINAVKRLRAKYGDTEAKRKVKDLILRSFTEEPEVLFRELRELLHGA